MPGDARSRGARLRRSLAVVGIAAATVVGFALPASAGEPPGWIDPVNGEWVAFAVVGGLPLAVSGRSTVAPVTVERKGTLSAPATSLAGFWESRTIAGVTDTGWPSSLADGSVVLQRVNWCLSTAPQCDYTVMHGGTFDLHAGGPVNPTDPPPPSFSVVIGEPPAPKVLHVGFVDPQLTPGSVGHSGNVVLDASSLTSDECTDCGALSYHWIVQTDDPSVPTQTFTSDTGPRVQLDISQDGTYCVQLTVTASNGPGSSTQSSMSTTPCTPGNPDHAPEFVATGFAPKTAPSGPPPPTPPAGGGGAGGAPTGGGGTGGGTGGGFGGITFSNPQKRAPAVLSSAGLSSPAVVWLWRPDFYQPTPEATTGAPITTNTPNLKGRHEIVVTRPGPNGASAGPWLAGMGAFGIAGGWWVFSRRRRLRLLELEP